MTFLPKSSTYSHGEPSSPRSIRAQIRICIWRNGSDGVRKLVIYKKKGEKFAKRIHPIWRARKTPPPPQAFALNQRPKLPMASLHGGDPVELSRSKPAQCNRRSVVMCQNFREFLKLMSYGTLNRKRSISSSLRNETISFITFICLRQKILHCYAKFIADKPASPSQYSQDLSSVRRVFSK